MGETVPAGMREPILLSFSVRPRRALSLTMHNIALVPTLAMIAVHSFLAMPLAYNLIVLSFFPVAGLSAFALARHVTGEYVGALVGGAMFMLCPFLTSKTLGHLNLMAAAFLPLYVLCLLRALDRPSRARRVWLTLVFVLIVFSNEHTLVFAANVTAWLWLFRAWHGRRFKAEASMFWRVLKPAVLFSLAWGAFLVYYAVRYGAVPYRTGGVSFCPEPLNFVLPLYPTSPWCEGVMPPGKLGWDMSTLEMAVYLGWLVFPLAVAGYCCLRRVCAHEVHGCPVYLLATPGPGARAPVAPAGGARLSSAGISAHGAVSPRSRAGIGRASRPVSPDRLHGHVGGPGGPHRPRSEPMGNRPGGGGCCPGSCVHRR